MKRKRRDKSSEVHKRPRVARVNASNHVPLPLLRQYYPHVATLRQFLATRSSVASKKRRRKIQQFGLQRDRAGEGQDVAPLADLLDTTLVGSFDSSAQLNLEGISKDISVFTQQVNESNTSISPTQGALKQSEVGHCPSLLLSSLPDQWVTTNTCPDRSLTLSFGNSSGNTLGLGDRRTFFVMGTSAQRAMVVRLRLSPVFPASSPLAITHMSRA